MGNLCNIIQCNMAPLGDVAVSDLPQSPQTATNACMPTTTVTARFQLAANTTPSIPSSPYSSGIIKKTRTHLSRTVERRSPLSRNRLCRAPSLQERRAYGLVSPRCRQMQSRFSPRRPDAWVTRRQAQQPLHLDKSHSGGGVRDEFTTPSHSVRNDTKR